MPEQIRCPDCAATLRVPDTLLGKKVKCPKCQTTFTAESAAEEPIEPEERMAREPARPSRRPAPPPDDYEEEAPPPEDDYEEEERPRRGRRRRSGAAASAVAGPAIALMVVAPLSILGGIVDLLFRFLNIGGNTFAASKTTASAASQSGFAVGMALGGTWDVLSILLPIVMIIGAIKMKKLESYGLALTTCILAMLPLHCCCILGLPFGIWGMVALNKPEVKNAFS